MSKKHGKSTVLLEKPPGIIEYASIVGTKEGEGPLGSYFDEIVEDPKFGMDSWEEAESEIQNQLVSKVLEKSGLIESKIEYIFAGDLLGQLIATSFGIMSYNIPLFGLYGACSTMGESLGLAAMIIDGGFADNALALTSSHFASAEKQFRFPLDYGNQRPQAATWTVTGGGAVILGESSQRAKVRVEGMTTGRIVDFGVKDSMNMGACMAPAAADTIAQNFQDLNIEPDHYDKIITGDLGYVGKKILIDLLNEKGYDISSQHTDCGIEIFDKETQDTHSGGSGCGCAGSTLCGYILKQMESKTWKRVLFVPTGALLSKISFNEGQSVPGIAHAVMLNTAIE